MSAIFYHLFEIRFRSLYIIFSILLTFLTTYYYSFELIYLFVRPFFAAKNFIFTDLTEALSITLKICLFFTLNAIIPYLLYQSWCFIIPSFLKGERKKINFFIFFSFLLFLNSSFIIYFFLLPEISQFLFTFQIKKELLTIQLKARIYSYVEFTIYVYSFGIFFFQTPVFLILLFALNILTPSTLSKIRRYYFFCSILTAAFISPPDILSQLCLASFFLIIYEISIWLGFIYQKKVLRFLFLREPMQY